MCRYQINGNLRGKHGLSNFDLFSETVHKVRKYFISFLCERYMDSIDLLVDNGTANTGYTPVITPVLDKYLIIKLSIEPNDSADRIAFQFAHELMHYVFYVKYGIGRTYTDFWEESICSAASLIVLRQLYPDGFERQYNHLKNSEDDSYREGIRVAEEIQYDFSKLIEIVLKPTTD